MVLLLYKTYHIILLRYIFYIYLFNCFDIIIHLYVFCKCNTKSTGCPCILLVSIVSCKILQKRGTLKYIIINTYEYIKKSDWTLNDNSITFIDRE